MTIALVPEPVAQAFQTIQLLTMPAFRVKLLELFCECISARECRSKDDSGIVAHFIRQAPSIRQLATGGRCFVCKYQGDARIAQCVDADRDGHGSG